MRRLVSLFASGPIWVMVLGLLLTIPALADEGGKQGPGTHMKVSGVVSQIKSGFVFVKTPWGQITIGSPGELKGLQVGEEVEMWMSENNVVIDVHRKGDPAHSHRYITGNLTYASKDRKAITLWTPEGERAFPVETSKTTLSAMEEGSTVTVELDEAGKVIDVHRIKLDIDLAAAPHTKPGYHIKLSGVVTKIDASIVHVKAQGADYHVSAKTAPADLKVGDELTLWVNQNNTVVDHHRAGQEKVHRLVTGKLIYMGKTKKQIKLWTPEGEKVFPLDRMEVKTKPIEEGALVTAELNEDGAVISLRKAH